jgi:hypothetical protein
LGPAGLIWRVGRAPASQLGACSFSRGVARRSGCGMKSWTLAAGPRASWTTIEIVSWATAEKSARLGCCPRQDDRWRSRSSSRELLAKRIRAWGSAEAATDQSGSWRVERTTLACSRVGWSLNRAIVAIASHSLALLHDQMPSRQLHALRPRTVGTVVMAASTSRGGAR